MARRVGDVHRRAGVEEEVAAVLEQGHVHVHSGSVHAEDRFGHEADVDVVGLCDLSRHEPVGDDIVGHREGVGVAEVHFVLAR